MPEKFDYRLLLETNVKITSYPSQDMEGFLELFLREVINITKSRTGYLFTYSASGHRVIEISGTEISYIVSNCKLLPRIFRSEANSIWTENFSITGRNICNQKSRLYFSEKDLLTENIVKRYLSIPLEDDCSSPLIVLVADKTTDYSISDFNILSQLSVPAMRIIKNLKTIDELRRKNEQETEKVKIKNSFIQFISHEVKTPLNSITGFSQLLREENQSAESCNKFTDIILESSNKLVRFINSVNEISDIETGLMRTVENNVNIAQLFSEIHDHFRHEADIKKIEFHINSNIPEADSEILADREKVKRVITELLTNSFQHTFTGRIISGCRILDDSVEFFVTDTGTGISEDHKTRVFSHFLNTGDYAVKSSEGAGLGLTIASAYVEHMGGRIWFNSSEGIGTSFFFTIPYKKVIAEKISDSIPGKGTPENRKKKKTILVAEDDNMNFFLIKVYLAKQGYNLTRAVNGKEAVDLCNSFHYDLVLMDIRMPEMDGYTATKKIKESNPEQIVIAQTAYTNDREIALSKGCDDFIAKPFGRQELISLVKSYL